MLQRCLLKSACQQLNSCTDSTSNKIHSNQNFKKLTKTVSVCFFSVPTNSGLVSISFVFNEWCKEILGVCAQPSFASSSSSCVSCICLSLRVLVPVNQLVLLFLSSSWSLLPWCFFRVMLKRRPYPTYSTLKASPWSFWLSVVYAHVCSQNTYSTGELKMLR